MSVSEENNPSPCYGLEVLYQNRYCNQENFDLIISSRYHYRGKLAERNISKVDYPRFSNAEILFANSHRDDIVLTSCSSIYILRVGVKERFKISPRNFSVRNNII